MEDTAQLNPMRALVSRGWRVFHQCEVICVILALFVTWHGILRTNQDIVGFAAVWGIICLTAAVAALWPTLPLVPHLVAQSVLLVVAVGQLIGPFHDLLPILGTKVHNADRWNAIPLTDRRIVTWNIVGCFLLIWFWGGAPIVTEVASLFRESGIRKACLRALFFLPGYVLFGWVFVKIVRAFFA